MTSQLDFFATPVLPATTQVAKPQAVARRGQDVIGPDDEAMASIWKRPATIASCESTGPDQLSSILGPNFHGRATGPNGIAAEMDAAPAKTSVFD